MKKVLITGVSGFAGQHLAEHLIESDSLTLYGTYHSDNSLDRLGELKNKITAYQVDLTNKEQVGELIDRTQPDEIYNLASQTSPSQSIKDPAETLTTNTLSELYLLEAIKNTNKDTKVLAISSAEVYGAIDSKDLPVDEDTPFRPTTPYAVSKITQDYLALEYFIAHQLQVIRARPFNHFGPRQQPKFVVPMFAKQIAEIEKGGQDPLMKVGNLKARKDFTDVRDVVRAYRLLMEKGIPGEVYNIGSGKSVEIQQILDTLISMSETKILYERDDQLYRLLDTPDIYCDYSKLKILTGWEPQISLEKTLKDTLDYFRKFV